MTVRRECDTVPNGNPVTLTINLTSSIKDNISRHSFIDGDGKLREVVGPLYVPISCLVHFPEDPTIDFSSLTVVHDGMSFEQTSLGTPILLAVCMILTPTIVPTYGMSGPGHPALEQVLVSMSIETPLDELFLTGTPYYT
jgi:hypothetical protein